MTAGTLSYTITANTDPLNRAMSQAKAKMSQANDAMGKASKDISSAMGGMSSSASKALGPMQQGLSAINPAAGSAVGGMKSMAMGAKALNVALGPVGLIITAIGLAIAALTQYFRGSVEGQQRMAKIMAYLGGVADSVKDLFHDLGRVIVYAFTNPREAVEKLWEVIKKNLINRFQGLVGMITSGWNVISKGAQGVAAAVQGIFSKEKRAEARQYFKEMADGMVEFGEAAVMAYTGFEVDDIVNAAKAIGGAAKEAGERAKANMALQERENQLKMDQIDATRDIAQLEAQIAEARRIANDDQEDLVDQIAAQDRAMELVAQKYAEKERLAKEELAIQQERMALGHDTIEDLEKEAQLQADLIKLQQGRDNEMRSLLRRHGTLMSQQESEARRQQEAIDAERRKREAVIDDIRRASMTEVELLEETMREKLDRHEWTEAERAEITKHYQDQITEIERAAEQQRLDEINRAEEQKEAARNKVLDRIKKASMTQTEIMKEQMDKELSLEGLTEEQKYDIRKYWLDKIAQEEQRVMDEMASQITDLEMLWEDLGKVMSASIAGAASEMGAALAGAEAGFKGLAQAALSSIQQIINGLLAKAIAGMIAGEASKGLLGLATAAVGVGAIKAMFASEVPKMAKGGVVPEGYPRDTYPALLSSGETVIPPKDLDHILSQFDTMSTGLQGGLTYQLNGLAGSEVGPKDLTQTVRQVVERPADTKPEDLTQRVTQALSRVKITPPGDITQRITQVMEEARSEKVSDLTQAIVQTVHEATISAPGDMTQRITQVLNEAKIPMVEDLAQEITQTLDEATINSPTDQTQHIAQVLNEATIGKTEDLTQRITQVLNEATISAPGDITQRITQVLNEATIGKTEDMTQAIVQTVHGVTIPRPDDVTQRVNQVLSTVQGPNIQEVSQMLQPPTVKPIPASSPSPVQQAPREMKARIEGAGQDLYVYLRETERQYQERF